MTRVALMTTNPIPGVPKAQLQKDWEDAKEQFAQADARVNAAIKQLTAAKTRQTAAEERLLAAYPDAIELVKPKKGEEKGCT